MGLAVSPTMPSLLSIQVGRPRQVEWRGEVVTTSIFKTPVTGPARVHLLDLEGDEQSDLTVHGGADKAVYVYPSEHYEFWARELNDPSLPPGAFGENLTTQGLIEQEVNIGDRLRIGSAEFLVTQPRMPCYKLQIRFNRADMVKRFAQSRRSGFYLRVLREGALEAGDAITFLSRDESGVSVTDIVNLYFGDGPDEQLLRRASELQALPENLRRYLGRHIQK
jgi:MOSC domain-containing protein YiiM